VKVSSFFLIWWKVCRHFFCCVHTLCVYFPCHSQEQHRNSSKSKWNCYRNYRRSNLLNVRYRIDSKSLKILYTLNTIEHMWVCMRVPYQCCLFDRILLLHTYVYLSVLVYRCVLNVLFLIHSGISRILTVKK
jgi:hypothetical protein